MKKLIPLLLCILLLAGCAQTYDGPTKTEYALTEIIRETYYDFFGWEESRYTDRTVYAYDIYGNCVRSMRYREDELVTVSNMKYDDRGNLLSHSSWDHSGWLPKYKGRTEQTYDGQNRLLSYVSYNFWGQQEYGSWYSYDDEAGIRTHRDETGEILQTTWYDENGKDQRQVSGEYETVYEYDDRGNEIGWVSYENGALTYRWEARYDDQNRIIWSCRHNASTGESSETTYEYDDEAHTVTVHSGNGDTHIEYYHPDGRLHMTEYVSADGGSRTIERYIYQQIQVPAKEE